MIICCGEALIDMLPRTVGGENPNGYLPVPGGALFNTAIALGRLGANTALLAGISNDMFGEQLIEVLQTSNVKTDLCIRSSQPTTLAFVKLVKGAAEYHFFDENSAMNTLDEKQIPPMPAAITALQFGGISLTKEPSAAAFEKLMQRYKTECIIAIDPNIRQGFIKDEQSYRSRLERMIKQSDIIKISNEDLEWLYPQERFEDVAKGWIKQGASLVILTLGDKGAQAFTRQDRLQIAAEQVSVVDTVGAGDVFNAGVLHNLQSNGLHNKKALETLSKKDAESALKFAAKVAAHTVIQTGANPPWLRELN